MVPDNRFVSIIVPTLNEEKTIRSVLLDVPPSIVDEIIIVDSSSDNTAKIATEFGCKIIRAQKRGYGYALQKGIEHAKGDIVIYMDADYTYDPKEIPKLVAPIMNGSCDVTLGSRMKGKMLAGSMSMINKAGNMILSSLLSLLFLKRFSDTQTGFRAIKRRTIESLHYREDGMSFATEQLLKLVKRGAKIEEVPVSYRPREGKSKLNPLIDGLRIFKTIIEERIVD